VMMSRDQAYDALRNIPAADVEALEVLKGPAAASLYPFAANGVVLVTTKRGR
jgi:TonB-dependent SusC/RagA subfamily outer membrane receptor